MAPLLKLKLYSVLLAITVLSLLGLGLLAIYTTTYSESDNYYLFRQLMWIAAGTLSAAAVALIPIDRLSEWSKWILGAVILALAYLMIANYGTSFGHKVLHKNISGIFIGAQFAKGACRWLNICGFSLQPSEFAKFSVILFLSSYYGMRDIQKIRSFRDGFLLPGIWCGVLLCCIYLGKALSNTLLTCLIVLTIMFLAGVRVKFLCYSALCGILLAAAGIAAQPYRRQRIINFLDKKNTTMTTGTSKADNHQLNRAICAMGSGGATGFGIGTGRMKNRVIPESKTDFIFAVIGEELGFMGVSAGLLLYLLFLMLSIGISTLCRDRRSVLLCLSTGIFVTAQAFFNISVVCGIIPTTGVTAPLVSYGGSSIVSMMMCVGLIFNVCLQIYREAMLETVVEPTISANQLPPLHFK